MISTERWEEIEEIKRHYSERRCTDVQQLLSTMANPIRFRLLCALRGRSFTVSELVEITDSNLPNVSQHLKMMWMAGYINKVRTGKQVRYNLSDRRIVDVIEMVEAMYPADAYKNSEGCEEG